MDLPINTVEDLLSDESFLAWYFKTDVVAVEKWNNRIALDPTQQELAAEAARLLSTITIKEQPVDAQRLALAEEKLRQATLFTIPKKPAAKRVNFWSGNIKWWAAAAVVVLVSLALWQYQRTPSMLAFKTGYGETRKDVLPDGSEVLLDANTTLNYKNREVWVNGEAFFHVKKTAHKDRFIVHTGHFDVIVTGTQFNVTNRNDKNNVLLKEGSVIIQGQQQEINMQPGDYVEFNNTGIQKKDVDSASILGWTGHTFVFDHTPMKEVAALVTEFFGIKVTLADDSVATSTISGIMRNDNLDVFLQSLEALPEYEIVKSDNEIRIRKK